jgi:hypothetical protein
VPARPNRRSALLRLALCAGTVLAGSALLLPGGSSNAADEPPLVPVPDGHCNAASKPETDIQGRVPASDYQSGRAQKGYTCNTSQVSHFGDTGGFKVFRYVDSGGHVCAIYDSTLMAPTDTPYQVGAGTGIGTYVLDMSDPAHPKQTANLVTPAMESPHESLYLNQKRGLLAAVAGNAATYPGALSVYELKDDCRHPVLASTVPFAGMGHESGFAPDGKTFYASATAGMTLVAFDLTDPTNPKQIAQTFGVNYHGMRVSRDGNLLYVANIGTNQASTGTFASGGLRIINVSSIQNREPNPQFKTISDLTWRSASIPQEADPIVIGGHKYVLENDEFANFSFSGTVGSIGYDPNAPVGAARLINVDDPKHPFVVSNIRLAVHQKSNRNGPEKNDPGASLPVQGYAGHYCSTPRYKNPGIVACSMIDSGLRIFDISNPYHPREVGYFNKPVAPGVKPGHEGSWAMSAPAWDLKHRMVWYTDGNSGFYAVRLAKSIVPNSY